MEIKNFYTYLKELERCEWHDNAIINGIQYNGISVEQGTETYQRILTNMHEEAEQSLLSLLADGQIKVLNAIYRKVKDVRESDYDIITPQAVEALKADFPKAIRPKAIRMEIELGQFVIDMHCLQLHYLDRLLSFISSLLEDNTTTVEVTPPEQENNNNTVQQREWFTLSEICDYFHLPMNNVKSKKWRDTNKFPYHQTSGIYGSISYCRSEVEDWLNAKTAAKC